MVPRPGKVLCIGLNDVDHAAERSKILAATIADGWKYVSDADARAVGTAHPDGNLWDNGSDALAEFESLLEVREHALSRFSQNNIRPGRPLAGAQILPRLPLPGRLPPIRLPRLRLRPLRRPLVNHLDNF